MAFSAFVGGRTPKSSPAQPAKHSAPFTHGQRPELPADIVSRQIQIENWSVARAHLRACGLVLTAPGAQWPTFSLSVPRSLVLSFFPRALSLSLSLSPSFVISLCCCSNANPLRFKRACCSFQGTASVERARTCIILLLCVGTPSVVADPAVGCHGGGGVDVGLAPLATTSPVSSSPPRNINGSPAGACAELQQLGVRAHCCPVPCISACSRLTCYVAALSFYCMHCHVAVVVVLGDS